MKFLRMIAEAPSLQEVIARAIFEHRYKRSWDVAKVNDQWLAIGTWEEAGAVLLALPLAVPA